jgi:hypothetical protein
MSVVTESLAPCPVPPITHPMGKHWDQPDPHAFEWHEDRVVMTREQFKALHDYSCSLPSGVYDGKMWRLTSHHGTSVPMNERRCFLRWFAPSDDPNQCSIHSLPLVIA